MINNIIQIILSVVVPGLILAFIQRRINQRGPRLVYYVSAATWFTDIFPQQQGSNRDLHVITIAIRNNGNQVARNIDISHFRWPMHFQVVPFVAHQVLPDLTNPRVIRLISLNPGETIWISYLFAQIINPDNFIEYVRSEEVMANRTFMILNPIFPQRVIKLLWLLIILGLIFVGVIIWWFYPPFVSAVSWIIKFPR